MVRQQQEIERKFLVKCLPPHWPFYPHLHITQSYLSIKPPDEETRLRQQNRSFFLTFKRGRGKTRREVEIKISRQEFQQLWQLRLPGLIKKTRYLIPYRRHLLEFDIYLGQHSSLLLVEVEFKTQRASQLFQPPAWFGTEVTQDQRYKNQTLFLKGKPH